MQKIVFASGNPGKLTEVRKLIANLPYEIISQQELNVTEVSETGLTFVENAIIKARNAAQQTGLPAIADDSGLQVDALNGAPGIYSARYAGSNASSKDNIEKLLYELRDVPKEQRSARFQCILVYMQNAEDPAPIICQGTWEGVILEKEQGTQGFGYDPIFFVPSHNCSAAELPLDVKNKVSHRGQALQSLISTLASH